MPETIDTNLALQKDCTDAAIIERVLAGDAALYEVLVRRYNQRVYRVVRSVLRDDFEAEDVMQEAYVRAYHHLGEFAGRSSFSTWLIRIAIHEALARVKKRSRVDVVDFADSKSDQDLKVEEKRSPDMQYAQTEARELLEQSILTLPSEYRMVLIMRDVEEISTAETAHALELTEENVK